MKNNTNIPRFLLTGCLARVTYLAHMVHIAHVVLVALGVMIMVDAHANGKILDIHHWTAANGAQVYFVAAPEVPMLQINIAFDAGSARDASAPGIAVLTNSLLNQGNNGLNATQVAENFDNEGAQYEASATRDIATISLRTLTTAHNMAAALSSFTAVITHPDFPAIAFKQKQATQILKLQQTQESAAAVANNAVFATVYATQPYMNPVLGTETAISSITLPAVKDFYTRFYVGNNATIALVGAIDVATAHQIVTQLTTAMPAGKKPAPLPLAPPLTVAVNKHIPFPSQQTVISLAQVGIRHDDPAYFPLLVGNYILGSGTMVSRLANAVREKRGLSYYIYSYFNPLQARGPFVITLATRSDQTLQALDITNTTLSQFLTTGPDAKELQAAQQYITGSFPLRFASDSDIANILIMIGIYHLPLDYLDTYVAKVNAVTIAQIHAAFEQQIKPQYLTTITVGSSLSNNIKK